MLMERIQQREKKERNFLPKFFYLEVLMDFCRVCKERRFWLLKCRCCGDVVTESRKMKRIENPHLCRSCNGEAKADYMPTPAEIALETAKIREEGTNWIGQMGESVFTPRVYRDHSNRRGRIIP